MIRHAAQPRGFTLLELVMVMLLMCVAMAIVAPSFTGFSKSARINDTVAQLVTLAHWARSQAISDGRVYRLSIDPQDGTYRLTAQSQDEFVELGSGFGRLFTLPEGVRISVDNAGKKEINSIDFYPNGRSQPAMIHLMDFRGRETLIGCRFPTEPFKVISSEGNAR